MYHPGVTEAIWHFAGYLHIADELARARISYEEFLHNQRIAADLYDAELKGARHELLNFESHGISSTKVDLPGFEARTQMWYGNAQKIVGDLPAANMHQDFCPDTGQWQPMLNIGGVGGLGANHWLIRYEGGDQKWIEIHQSNHMVTNNYVDVDKNSGVMDLNGTDAQAELGAMIKAAGETVPDEFRPDGETGSDIHEFFVSHQQAYAEAGEAPSQVAPGLYVDGVLQEEGASLKLELFDDDGNREGAPIAPQTPENWTHEDGVIQSTETGGKLALNSAVIVDANEACGTMMVLGNWYVTNAVFQTNVYTDNDHVTVGGSAPGTGLGALIQTGDNIASNRAEFGKLQLLEEEIDNRGLTGYNWDIQIVNGDFFDIKALFQENYVTSTDITLQTHSAFNYFLTVDGTGQINNVYLKDVGGYDLIVVLGDYHSGNYIKQTNVLLDNDHVMSASLADGSASQAIYTGQNYLLNAAGIYSYGTEGFQGITDNIDTFLTDLQEADYIQPQEWWAISGSGSTTMNVLFVTGNYYDINYICQTNVISDIDTALQVFSPDGAGGQQFLSTGANTAENFASIVDFGAYGDQFLGGEMYEESVLIQTNIIAGDNDDIVYGDSTQLASEIVAFATGPDSDGTEGDNPGFTSGAAIANGDELGSIMT